MKTLQKTPEENHGKIIFWAVIVVGILLLAAGYVFK